jgi:tetratricopeptide (TPR) repeat protein
VLSSAAVPIDPEEIPVNRHIVVVPVFCALLAFPALLNAQTSSKPKATPPATAPAKAPAPAATAPAPAATAPAATAPAPAASAPTATPAVTDSLGILERAVAKDSTKFDNLYKLGVMYLDRDRTTEAAKVFTRALKIKPKDVRTMVNLGAAYDAAGAPLAAQAYYRQALGLTPHDSVATCRLASSIYAQGSSADPAKYQEAVDLLRDLIKRSPNAHCAYFTLGVAFADAGLYRDAIAMWHKVVALAPGSPEAVSAMESIEVLDKFVTK